MFNFMHRLCFVYFEVDLCFVFFEIYLIIFILTNQYNPIFIKLSYINIKPQYMVHILYKLGWVIFNI